MMTDFFVTTSDVSNDLRIESAQFAQALTERWPNVRFVEQDHSANVVRWAIPMPSGHNELWGDLQSTGRTVALEGDDYDVAEFAKWLRQQIPARYPLVFFDEGYTTDIPLTAEISAEELLRPFLLPVE